MPIRTLPHEAVQACARALSKKTRTAYARSAVEIGRNQAVQGLTSKLFGCAQDHMTSRFGPPSGPVLDRIETVAHRTAAGIMKRELKLQRASAFSAHSLRKKAR